MAFSREKTAFLPLAFGVVVALLVLGTVMYRSSFQLGQLRERSVVEATLSVANEKADRLEKRIIEQDNAVRGMTRGEGLARFGSKWLAVAKTQTPSVRAAVLLDLESPSHEVAAYASRAVGSEDDDFRRMLLQHFLPQLNLGGDTKELRHLHTALKESSYLLSHWDTVIEERNYLVVLWHDVPRIVHDIFPRLYSDDAGLPSRVNVVDAKGRIIFGPPLSRGALTLGRQFETTLYKWRVNVSMAAAETLAAEVEQRRLLEMALIALSSVIVCAGLLVSVLAALRERKLASLKSEFVANVSHELKTPLSLVRMFSDLLLSGRAPPQKQKQYLEIIVAESERLTALIDNVLDFARVERGESAYTFQVASVHEALSRAVEVCRPRAERQGIELFFDPDPNLDALASIDEGAVEMAVINLIDNALKYAEGSKVVYVGLRREGRHLVISVEDEGPGIPASQRKRIFERFVRGHHEAGEKQRGSGIGLSLVAQIAGAHRGRAWTVPREGGGARFLLSLKAPVRLPFRRSRRPEEH